MKCGDEQEGFGKNPKGYTTEDSLVLGLSRAIANFYISAVIFNCRHAEEAGCMSQRENNHKRGEQNAKL